MGNKNGQHPSHPPDMFKIVISFAISNQKDTLPSTVGGAVQLSPTGWRAVPLSLLAFLIRQLRNRGYVCPLFSIGHKSLEYVNLLAKHSMGVGGMENTALTLRGHQESVCGSTLPSH